MATPSLDFIKYPLGNVKNLFGALPQGHEKALKQAVYNALALFFLVVCSATGWALFIILGPFLKPLVWALLCGSVLHPFKYSLSTKLQKWIETLDCSTTPLFLGVLMTPFKIIDDVSEMIGSRLVRHAKFILATVILIATLHLLYYYTPHLCVCIIWQLGVYSAGTLGWFIANFNTHVVTSLVIGYLIVLIVWWGPQTSRKFAYTSFIMWMFVSCYLANQATSFQVPIFFLIQILYFMGLLYEVWQVKEKLKSSGSEATFLEVLKWTLFHNTDEYPSESISVKEEEEEPIIKLRKSKSNEGVSLHDACPEEGSTRNAETPKESAGEGFNEQSSMALGEPNVARKRLASLPIFPQMGPREHKVLSRPETMPEQFETEGDETESTEGDIYLYGVMYACGLMLLWKHNWIIHFVPIPVSIYMLKHLGHYSGLWTFLGRQWNCVVDILQTWCGARQTALFPASVKGLFEIVKQVNVSIIRMLHTFTDSAASIVVILGLIVFTISTSIFIALQLYSEGLHLIQVGASVVNNSVIHNSDVMDVLPGDWQDKVDSILDDAYVYGREGISKVVRGWLKDVDKSKAEHLEKQLLELWDRVYQAWMMSSTEPSSVGPSVTVGAIFTSWESFVDGVRKTPELFNLTAMMAFARENFETLVSLLDSLWSIFKGNMNLAMYSVTASISIVFGGGTAVLNFVLNLVVFLSALFYLLSSSGDLYIPVTLITNFSPINGNRFAVALGQSINGVFRASFKLAVFYGLWTWFVHNLFSVNIVYLPSVLAATLGAVPFLGTYWAGVPAVLDLWLAQDKGMQAVTLLVFHFLPCSMVNTAFYKEINGGGHPYLTGLAIAGGIFWLGVEGAIVGPLVLCGLFVVVNMSSTIMKESPSDTDFNLSNLTQLSTQLRGISGAVGTSYAAPHSYSSPQKALPPS